MSIRQKTVLIALITFLSLFVMLYGTAYAILLNSYTQLENQNVLDNIERTRNTLASRLDDLGATTADWAYWDDTYLFARGDNEDYVEANLSHDSLAVLGLNLVLYLDSKGEILFSKSIDLQTGEEEDFSPELAAILQEGSRLLDPENLTDVAAGFVHGPDGAAMLAVRHILNNQAEGPIEGTLIFGRYLDTSRLSFLSNLLRTSLSLYLFEGGPLPQEIRNARDSLLAAGPVFSKALDEERTGGYILLQDLWGEPIGLLRLDIPREIYAQGQNSLNYFLLSLVLIGAVFTLTVLLLNDRLIFSRLSRLSEEVAGIRDTGEISTGVSVSGHDEISHLGNYINSMLSRLLGIRKALQDAHDNLEAEVDARTAELRQEIIMRKQAQIELQRARDEALTALRFKSQVLANMSHDARTPLTVISLRAQMIQRGMFGPVTEAQQQKLEGILMNARQLLGFMDNMLTASLLENNKLSLNPVETPVTRLLEPLAETIKPLANNKGLALSWAVVEDTPQTVLIDPARFDQILMNLVDNAIKFTDHGSVEVQIYRADAGHWALKVADTGPGIPLDAQKHIFDTFWQADGSLTRTVNRGVGLGLSIVKKLVEMMGAEIRLNSQPDMGAVFTVIFPLAEVTEEPGYEHTKRADY